jgi:tetratricopeptide (TPR) repeat protein
VALGLAALLVLYRPFTGGLVYGLVPTTAWMLACMLAVLAWLIEQGLRGEIRVRMGAAGWCFAALLLAGLVSALRAGNWFAGLHWWVLFATYGLTGFAVLQAAADERARRLLGACLLATGAAVAAYALWHAAFYKPALRDWLQAEGELFRTRLGLGSAMAGDLRARVESTRVGGHFLTANQLADFLLLTGFPLAGFALWARRRGRAVFAGATCAAGAAALVFVLTRSKGAAISGVFGLGVLGLTAGRGWVQRHLRAVALVSAGVLVLAGAAMAAGLAPGPGQFAESFAVRVGYWRTSVRIFLRRPLLGVGPGSWGPWYAMLKQPGFEETQSAHNAYLQMLSENGAAGLLLFAGFLALAFRRCLARPVAEQPAEEPSEPQGAPTVAPVLAAGLALLLHAVLVRGLHPPAQGGPEWLRTAWLAPYVLVAVVWGGVYHLAVRSGVRWRDLAPWAVAGLAAFLLHSAAEVTWRIPALGGTAMALMALTAACSDPPRARRVPIKDLAGGLLVLLGALLVMLWTLLGVQRALSYDTHLELAEANRRDLRTGAVAYMADPRTAARRIVRATTRHHAAACQELPWHWEGWLKRGEWLASRTARVLDPENASLQQAAECAHRAARLAPYQAVPRKLLGDVMRSMDRHDEALQAYRQARDLHPSLPTAWFAVARQAERAGRPPEVVCANYAQALALLPRQYHERNRVVARREQWLDFVESFSDDTPDLPDAPSPALRRLLGSAAVVARLSPGAAGPPPGHSARETARHLAQGVPDAAAVVQEWDALSAEQRSERLWQTLAPRLWLWALQARLHLCTTMANAHE